MQATRLERLSGRIYDAAVEPSLWVGVLDEFVSLTGGSHAVLLAADVITGAGKAIGSSGLDPATFASYFAHYAAINPLSVVNDFADYCLDWRPMMKRDEEWLPRQTLEKSEYWCDFLRPLDACRGLPIRLQLDGTVLHTLNLARGYHQDHFSDAEIARLETVHAHAVRAARIGSRFAKVEGLASGVSAALDAIDDPMMLLDGQGRVIFANAAADGLIADGRIIAASRKRVVKTAISSTAFADALTAANAPGVRRGSVLALTDETGASAGEASILPIGVDSCVDIAGGTAVLVRVALAKHPQRVDARMTRYGLTRAEAALTRLLLDGLDLKAAAAARGISIHTVRRQLSDVFDKTSTCRQAELVALLTRDD